MRQEGRVKSSRPVRIKAAPLCGLTPSCILLMTPSFIFSVLDSTEVLLYNSNAEEWIPSSPLNRRRHDFGITTYGGQIFVAGGIDGGMLPLRSVEVFSSETNQWTTQRNGLTRARAYLTLGNMTRKMYAVGGGSAGLPIMDSFGDVIGMWARVTHCQSNYALLYQEKTTAIAQDNKVFYCIGGMSRNKDRPMISERLRFVYIYDTFGSSWFRIPDLLEGRSGARAVVMFDCKMPRKPYRTSATNRRKMFSENTPSWSLQHGTTGQSGTCGDSDAGGGTPPKSQEQDLKPGPENMGLSNVQEHTSSRPTSSKSDIWPKGDETPSPSSRSAVRYESGVTPDSPSKGPHKHETTASNPSGIPREVGGPTPTNISEGRFPGGARPKTSAPPKRSPDAQREINTTTRSRHSGANIETGWHDNEGRSPTADKQYDLANQSVTKSRTRRFSDTPIRRETQPSIAPLRRSSRQMLTSPTEERTIGISPRADAGRSPNVDMWPPGCETPRGIETLTKDVSGVATRREVGSPLETDLSGPVRESSLLDRDAERGSGVQGGVHGEYFKPKPCVLSNAGILNQGSLKDLIGRKYSRGAIIIAAIVLADRYQCMLMVFCGRGRQPCVVKRELIP